MTSTLEPKPLVNAEKSQLLIDELDSTSGELEMSPTKLSWEGNSFEPGANHLVKRDKQGSDNLILPGINLTDSFSGPELTELPSDSDSAELERPSDYEYIDKPTEIVAKEGETLKSIANEQARKFLGPDYDELANDPVNFQSLLKSYKKALVSINGLSDDSILKPGQHIILPGKNTHGEPIYLSDGKITIWSGNSVFTREPDGTDRTDYDDGSYSITRPDNTQESKDVFGVVSHTKQLEDGTWVTTRSDNTYKKENYEKGTLEELDKKGVLTTLDEDKTHTRIYPNGEKFQEFSDGRKLHIDANQNVTQTDKSGVSSTFDRDGKLVGQGLQSGTLKIEFGSNFARSGRLDTVTGIFRKDFNFTLSESTDNKLELMEENSDRPVSFVNEGGYKSLAASRQELLKQVDDYIEHPIMKAKFKADMIRFENRAKARGILPENVESTYKSVGKLFQENRNSPIDDKGRAQIASELMSDLSKPYTISQGNHKTCNVKVLHVMLSAKNPEKIARLISEVALTGKHTLPDGKVVNVPRGTLIPQSDSLNFPRKDGERGFAGQLFDSTAINALGQSKNHDYRLDYLAKSPELKGYETGDILVDNKTNSPKVDSVTGNVVEFNGLLSKDIVETYRLLVGDNDAQKDWLLDPRLDKSDSDGVKGFGTIAELKDILSKFKKEGEFPMPIHVNTRMAPFWSDSGNGIAGGSGGGHVINITDYDPTTGKIKIDNQWSTNQDRLTDDKSIPIEQLFHASLSVNQIAAWVQIETIRNTSMSDFRHFNIEMLKQLSRVLQGSDPSLMAGSYDIGASDLAESFSGTNIGDVKNTEYMDLYKTLRPSAQLTVLGEVVVRKRISESMDREVFDKELTGLIDRFELESYDIERGLKALPRTKKEAKAAHIFLDDREGREILNRGKLELIAIISRLPDSHRKEFMDKLKADHKKKQKEDREFARINAE